MTKPAAVETSLDQLIEAVKLNHVERVKVLLRQGVDPNEKDKYGRLALGQAADHGHIGIVLVLLNADAEINLKDNNGQTALMKAAVMGRTEVARLLLDRGADINAADQDDATALILSVVPLEEAGNKLKMTRLLLEWDADLTPRDCDDDTALDIAENNYDDAQIRLLKDFESPLVQAVENGDAGKVERLLLQGADIDGEKNMYGLCALSLAAEWGRIDIAELLVREGADVNKRNRQGVTPLIKSVISSTIEIAQILVENGADPTLCNEEGFNPLDIAEDNGDDEMMALLQQAMQVKRELQAKAEALKASHETAQHNQLRAAANASRYTIRRRVQP